MADIWSPVRHGPRGRARAPPVGFLSLRLPDLGWRSHRVPVPPGARGPLHSRYPRTCDASVTEVSRIRDFSSTGRIAMCSSSFPIPRGSTMGGSRSAGSPPPSSCAPTAARSSSTTRRPCARRRGPIARPRPRRPIVYGTKAFPNLAVLRLLAEEGIGADVSTLGELRFARGGGPHRRPARLPREQQVRRGARGGRRGRRARRRRLARGGRPRPRGGRRPNPDPRHPRDRGRHPRVDPHGPPRLEVRAHARRLARGDPPYAGGRGTPRPHRLQLRDLDAARMTVDWITSFAARARESLGWELRTLDLGGGLGVAATREEARALDRGVRRRPARRARPRPRRSTASRPRT